MSWLQKALLEAASDAENRPNWELVLESAIENEQVSFVPAERINLNRLVGDDLNLVEK
jgi:hypothetical protein